MARGSIHQRILRSGTLRWDAYYDVPDYATGKRGQHKRSFKTRGEAESFLAEQHVVMTTGMAIGRSTQTVAETLSYWLETYARHNVSPATFDRYETIVRVHINPLLGAVPVQRLTPTQVQTFYSTKLAAGCGPRTVRLCHLHLAQALRQAVHLGLLARTVTDGVRPPRVTSKEMGTWLPEEARRFLAVCHESVYGPVWLVALATGMRRGEVLGLRWRDVDWDRRVLCVRQSIGRLHGAPDIKAPKTKSSRRDIPVQQEVLDGLHEHKWHQNERRLAAGEAWHNHDLVFTSTSGTPIHPDNLKRDYNRLVKRAGVPRIRIHDLRHTHVTLAIQHGANIKAVSQRVGHKDVAITLSIYAHVLPAEHADVADKIGAVLFRKQTEPREGVV